MWHSAMAFAMPSVAARSSCVLSAALHFASALSSDSEAFTRSDSLLPLSAGRSMTGPAQPAPFAAAAGVAVPTGAGAPLGVGVAFVTSTLRVRYASAPSSAPFTSFSGVGRSTWRSRSTW